MDHSQTILMLKAFNFLNGYEPIFNPNTEAKIVKHSVHFKTKFFGYTSEELTLEDCGKGLNISGLPLGKNSKSWHKKYVIIFAYSAKS